MRMGPCENGRNAVSYALRDFGSYTVAGRIHRVLDGAPFEVSFTRSASYLHDPRGHFAVEHAYVQYFIPESRNDAPPIVLVHGGGMHGSVWETTPDGRPGWLNLLVAQGYEVHVLDNVERGRSGFAPDLWEGAPLARSMEQAWSLFRIGPPDGFADRRAFPGTAFPVAAFDAFAQMLVPRWLTTTPLHVTALTAVLQRVGPAIVICHSQGGEIALDALYAQPTSIQGLIAIEPSTRLQEPRPVAHVPMVVCAGSYLNSSPHWESRERDWADWVAQIKACGGHAELVTSGPGHSHLPMLDRGNAACLSACLTALGL